MTAEAEKRIEELNAQIRKLVKEEELRKSILRRNFEDRRTRRYAPAGYGGLLDAKGEE